MFWKIFNSLCCYVFVLVITMVSTSFLMCALCPDSDGDWNPRSLSVHRSARIPAVWLQHWRHQCPSEGSTSSINRSNSLRFRCRNVFWECLFQTNMKVTRLSWLGCVILLWWGTWGKTVIWHLTRCPWLVPEQLSPFSLLQLLQTIMSVCVYSEYLITER